MLRLSKQHLWLYTVYKTYTHVLMQGLPRHCWRHVCLGCIELLAEQVGLASDYSLCTAIRHSSDDKQATHQQLKQQHWQPQKRVTLAMHVSRQTFNTPNGKHTLIATGSAVVLAKLASMGKYDAGADSSRSLSMYSCASAAAWLLALPACI